VWHVFALSIDDPFYGLFKNFADLSIYRAGGDAIVHRTGLYDDAILFGMQFTYTPFAAIVFAPFALVSQTVTNLVWWSATFAALVALIAVSFRSLGYRLVPRLWLLSTFLAVAVTALEPVRSTIWFGQINVFLVLLVVWDLTRPAGSRLRGTCSGIAAGIKLTPLFFLANLAVTRQWRTAVTTGAAFAATIALGFAVVPADAWSYWTQQVMHAGRVGPVDAPSNQSANGMLAQLLRFYDVTAYQDPVTGVFAPPTWMWLLFAGTLAAAGLAHRRPRPPPRARTPRCRVDRHELRCRVPLLVGTPLGVVRSVARDRPALRRHVRTPPSTARTRDRHSAHVLVVVGLPRRRTPARHRPPHRDRAVHVPPLLPLLVDRRPRADLCELLPARVRRRCRRHRHADARRTTRHRRATATTDPGSKARLERCDGAGCCITALRWAVKCEDVRRRVDLPGVAAF
jgi:hypothetical protein